jgi:hypothetical protein
MAMHFLIATSLLDMGKRHSISAVHLETSRTHFQKGKELLVRTMMRETKPDHFGTLSSWLFLYQCMMHKETLDPQAIDQVGQSILHYIELYNLDTIAAAPLSNLQDMPFSKYQRSSSLDAGLIARLITFLMHTDVHIAFQGCGGHLANYLHSNGVHQRIISSQRCVLEQFWGSSYPEDEVHQDIEVSIAWQMSYDVLVIFQTINELNRSSQGFVPRNSKMERSLKEIENVSHPEFHSLQCHFLMNYSIYFHVSTMTTPSHIAFLLINISEIQRHFSTGKINRCAQIICKTKCRHCIMLLPFHTSILLPHNSRDLRTTMPSPYCQCNVSDIEHCVQGLYVQARVHI